MERKLLKDTDADDLERAAAVKEFTEGHTREDAENEAYHEYLKEHHEKAAAYHLQGLRASQATEDFGEAQKHGEAYHKHMETLGHDPMDQVPDAILAHIKVEGRTPHYKFKAHAADKLLTSSEPEIE